MPNTASATKALRQSEHRQVVNTRIKRAYKSAVNAMRENPSAKTLQAAYSKLDRAAKKGVIKQNKASRLKSRLTRLLG